MATSGTTTFNMSARQLITSSLQRINMLAEHEAPSASQAARAMSELNILLKDWQKYENLWRLTEGSINLANATASYALTPIPHKVISARYRNASGIDLPMELMTREEYYDLPNKSASGTPTQYYVDYQRAAVTFYTWPVLETRTTETIKYTYQRKFEDIASLNNDIDVKQEHFRALDFNLAATLADCYGRTGAHIDRVIARAQMLLNDVLDDDREGYIQFVPDRR
jgi:hypothetical protein